MPAFFRHASFHLSFQTFFLLKTSSFLLGYQLSSGLPDFSWPARFLLSRNISQGPAKFLLACQLLSLLRSLPCPASLLLNFLLLACQLSSILQTLFWNASFLLLGFSWPANFNLTVIFVLVYQLLPGLQAFSCCTRDFSCPTR
jgi:hypothetical protein